MSSPATRLRWSARLALVAAPWPAAAARADIAFDGPRAVRAIERYETESGAALIDAAAAAAPAATR